MKLRLISAITLVLGLLSTPLVADAQQPGKVARIGYLQVPPREQTLQSIKALEDGLRERGYVQGRNIVIEYRSADGKPERLPELAAELVRLKVDVIVTGLNPVTVVAKQATTTIPIVTVLASDPVGAGLVASLARPGGNVTGLTFDVTPEIAGKRLQLLKEFVPQVSRVAVLWNPSFQVFLTKPYLKAIEEAARKLGVRHQLVEVRGPKDFEAAFAAMIRERVNGLLVISDPLIFTHRRQVVDFATRNRLPSGYAWREFSDLGGLISYGPSLGDLYRRTAIYVDKILKGAKPGDLPIEQPTKFELVINLKTAKALGLTIPQSLLIRADDVIQ